MDLRHLMLEFEKMLHGPSLPVVLRQNLAESVFVSHQVKLIQILLFAQHGEYEDVKEHKNCRHVEHQHSCDGRIVPIAINPAKTSKSNGRIVTVDAA